MPMGSLFAWVPRRPRGSWETHHASCAQGFPLGTHSHLCQLLWREGSREIERSVTWIPTQKTREAQPPDSRWPLRVQTENPPV